MSDQYAGILVRAKNVAECDHEVTVGPDRLVKDDILLSHYGPLKWRDRPMFIDTDATTLVGKVADQIRKWHRADEAERNYRPLGSLSKDEFDAQMFGRFR